MSILTPEVLITWLIGVLALSTVSALPQNARRISKGNNANDSEIVVHINDGPVYFPPNKDGLALRVNGSDGSTITINTMNHKFDGGPITVYKAKIIRAPSDYGCYFWTAEGTVATTSFPTSGTSSKSSFSSGVSSPASSVSRTFYTGSTGITVDNAFLNGEFLTCFPLTDFKGSVLGSDQKTYDIVGIYVSILVPLNPSLPVNPETGNAKFLVAPLVPIRLEPDMTSPHVSNVNDDISSGSVNEEGEGGENNKMIGFYPFPDDVILHNAAIVHAPKPNVRCRAIVQDGNMGPEFSVDTPLPNSVNVVKGIKCYY